MSSSTRVVLFASLVVCLGCARKPPLYIPPVPPPDPPPVTVPAPAPVGMPASELNQMMDSDLTTDVTPKESLQAIQRANTQAIIRPRRRDMRRSIVVYPAYEGAVYEIRTAFRQPTTLIFDGDERVKRWYGLDDFWDLERHLVGDPPHVKEYVLLTPKDAGLRMDLTLLTNKRVLSLAASSHKTTRMVAVRWQQDSIPKTRAPLLKPGVYYTDYDITVESGAPPWTPMAVWDTGLSGQTLIQFPPVVQSHEAPVFYVLSDRGEKHLTNWANLGQGWYLINRLVHRGELRVGHTSEVVILSKGAKYRAIRCPADPACPTGVPE